MLCTLRWLCRDKGIYWVRLFCVQGTYQCAPLADKKGINFWQELNLTSDTWYIVRYIFTVSWTSVMNVFEVPYCMSRAEQICCCDNLLTYLLPEIPLLAILRNQDPEHMPRMHRSLKTYCATLLTPLVFRCSHFRRQVSPRPHDVRDPSSERWNLWARILTSNFA